MALHGDIPKMKRRRRAKITDDRADILYRMRLMRNNNRWIFQKISPYLKGNIIEIGSGIGNISNFLVPLTKNIVLTDIENDYIECLQRKFAGNSSVRVISHDISSGGIDGSPFDTIICVNVLEHIKNDDKALTSMHNMMDGESRLILLVPAFRVLYGTLDKRYGHHRRYNKSDLLKKLKHRNFIVEEIQYHNLIAVLGWFVNARVVKKRTMSRTQIKIFDKLVPLLKRLEERLRVPFGLSLMVICKKDISQKQQPV